MWPRRAASGQHVEEKRALSGARPSSRMPAKPSAGCGEPPRSRGIGRRNPQRNARTTPVARSR
eukprot:2811527-Prymnesium_polylepis.1